MQDILSYIKTLEFTLSDMGNHCSLLQKIDMLYIVNLKDHYGRC